jgi:hypothetical protein
MSPDNPSKDNLPGRRLPNLACPPGKNAATGPGNRYPGTGHHGPATLEEGQVRPGFHAEEDVNFDVSGHLPGSHR